jgi:SPFH domain / Band 7 family
MSDKRQLIADETEALLQKLLDDQQAGVEITQVQLQRVEPPLAVIDAFNDVQRARADQERARNEAKAYAGSGHLLRNGAAMGFEVRTVVRQRTSPSTPAANGPVASRRDGRDDCGPAVLAVACS